MGRLDGKICIVTGAGSGIGRASAVLFAKEGGKVVVSDVSEDGVRETHKLIKEAGGTAIEHVCDVGDEGQVEAMVQRCTKELGVVDVMFANAGINNMGPFWTETAEDFARIFRVNVIGVFLCFKYASMAMMDAGKPGSLVATASVAGIRSGAGDAAYSSSKSATMSLCRVVANQLTGTGIRCNALCPGLSKFIFFQKLGCIYWRKIV